MRLRWPEMAEFAFGFEGHELRLFRQDISDEEMHAIASGQVEFSILPGTSVMFLLYRIATTEVWSYVPVSWWLLCNKQRTLPEHVEPDAIITIYLVNARNGRICLRQPCRISEDINQALIETLKTQSGRPYEFLQMSEQLQLAYQQHPAEETPR
jgi:hypothetical protein